MGYYAQREWMSIEDIARAVGLPDLARLAEILEREVEDGRAERRTIANYLIEYRRVPSGS